MGRGSLKFCLRQITESPFGEPIIALNLEIVSGYTPLRNDVDLHERLTMRGVFLHVLGDTISSVNVIASALLIKFIDDDYHWKYKIDPIARQTDSFHCDLCVLSVR